MIAAEYSAAPEYSPINHAAGCCHTIDPEVGISALGEIKPEGRFVDIRTWNFDSNPIRNAILSHLPSDCLMVRIQAQLVD